MAKPAWLIKVEQEREMVRFNNDPSNRVRRTLAQHMQVRNGN